jgi:hypothetical protein
MNNILVTELILQAVSLDGLVKHRDGDSKQRLAFGKCSEFSPSIFRDTEIALLVFDLADMRIEDRMQFLGRAMHVW